MENFYRDTWAEIDLSAIFFNIKEILKQLPNETKLFAAVKANGYGHGDVPVARAALAAGAHGLLVAFLDEALVLRNNGITAPILVLGATRPEDAWIAAQHNISLTVFQKEWLLRAQENIPSELKLSVHLKCDTGMNRIGIKTVEELLEIQALLQQSEAYVFEGIFTHFATADSIDDRFFQKQLKCFNQFLNHLTKTPTYIHAANSAASLLHKDSIFNAIRVGIALYGLSPSPEIKAHLPVKGKEAFSLHSKIVHVKKINRGEQVGYGGTYTSDKEEWIATIPIGYADGWIRRLQGIEVLAGGEFVPIVGRICMDQTMIKLPYPMPIGTKVTLIGEQAGNVISVDHIAEKLDTINYEVTCTITSRVPRIYVINGKPVQAIDEICDESF